MTDVVLFEELDCKNGKKIAVATLNSAKSLNALSKEMIALLSPQLIRWQNDSSIAMVLLQGTGEKAFCAGGDVVHLYKEMVASSGETSANIAQYFAEEYQLDYLIHSFNKPILCWGNGIIMGGGLGLLVGASHRVVTETARIAMPEITIGLLPDVGATWFLNKMPYHYGLFLGLTGASINSTDAKYINIADYLLDSEAKDNVITQLTQVNWGDTLVLNHEKLSQLLRENEQNSVQAKPVSELKKHSELLKRFAEHSNVEHVVNDIVSTEFDGKWFARAQASLKHGSPLSAQLVFQQLKRGKTWSLAQCFQHELSIATKCAQFGEFQEGVRALLIDKDNQPNWRYKKIEEVPSDIVNWFFESLWSESEHPLVNLEQ